MPEMCSMCSKGIAGTKRLSSMNISGAIADAHR